MPRKKDPGKLRLWQDRLKRAEAAYQTEVDQMDRREELYQGSGQIRPIVPTARKTETPHVRNLCAEMIESQVDANIPQPKVTPRRGQDEWRAKLIEDMLRNELDRLPFEQINDLQERTVPIQGGAGFLVEWDNSRGTRSAIGEVSVSPLHPRQIVPQDGVYTGIEDMDYLFLKLPQTKGSILRTYGVDVSDASEEDPEIKGDGGSTAEDMVTQYVAYYRNRRGGVGRFSWVRDTVLEDLEDYQARRQPVCRQCGRVRPLPGQLIQQPAQAPNQDQGELLRQEAGQMLAQTLAQEAMAGGGGLDSLPVEPDQSQAPREYQGGGCPWCGCEEFEDQVQEYEQVLLPITTGKGLSIPGATPDLDQEGNPVMRPTLIPFYKPGVFPIVLQRSVSVYGQLLGNSDVDMIADQQNTINRLEQKIIDRLVKAGTRITLPDNASLRVDSQDGERWYIGSAADKAMIGVYDFKGDLEYELLYLANVYEEARQILGITDSFQGRADSTATSGKAKEFSAAQAAGRLESKRVMKNKAYADLFRMMFEFWLAYGDEPRPVTYQDAQGHTQYEQFNRYDFLEQDSDGQYYWNDQFLFSVDTTDTLASNREAMWQETRQNLQNGAFGDPAATETLILFWTKMEQLHYPGAGDTKQALEQRAQREAQMGQSQRQLTQGDSGNMPDQMRREAMA